VPGRDHAVKGAGVVGPSASTAFVPRVPGTYRVICEIPGHEQVAMVGTLVVK
jgi:uncharacterized cupredoxin-like copper-binding protein